ncbi:MAG: PD40 domain-containing protein, partial [Solirubrobacteraceae bacterium]|nr:PD40 domain-containing protein [Solirubrobacteraceae bacterium]
MKTTALTTTLLAAAAIAAFPAAAGADSISYIGKDQNIWLTTPDGARQFQVTSTGRYAYASQADDGSFIASLSDNSELLHRLDRWGNVLAEFKTPVSDGATPANAQDNHFEGPYAPDISPDGTKVAYTYYHQSSTYDPTACGGTGCLANTLRSGTAITHPNRLTSWDELGGNLTGWKDPQWLNGDELVRSDAGVALSENVVMNRVSQGPSAGLVRWMKAEAISGERSDAVVNNQKTKMALVDRQAGPAGTFTAYDGIRLYRMTNAFDAPPEACFRYQPEDKSTTDAPTWSPDGNAVAFDEGAGIRVLPVPDMTAQCGAVPGQDEGRVIIPASVGHYPDWGPADVPT